MSRLWPFIAMLWLGCAERAAPAAGPVDLVAHCADVVTESRGFSAASKYSYVALNCLRPLLREPVCRDAVVRSLQGDAASQATTITSACASAYCPRIDAPRPGLCTPGHAAATPAELTPLAADLFARLRVLELGAAESARWDQLVRFPLVPAVEPPAPPLTVRLTAQGEAFIIAIGEQSWQLVAKPADSDFDAPAKRVAQLAKPGEKVIIEVGPNIQYHHLTGMLNALGVRNIRNISVQ